MFSIYTTCCHRSRLRCIWHFADARSISAFVIDLCGGGGALAQMHACSTDGRRWFLPLPMVTRSARVCCWMLAPTRMPRTRRVEFITFSFFFVDECDSITLDTRCLHLNIFRLFVLCVRVCLHRLANLRWTMQRRMATTKLRDWLRCPFQNSRWYYPNLRNSFVFPWKYHTVLLCDGHHAPFSRSVRHVSCVHDVNGSMFDIVPLFYTLCCEFFICFASIMIRGWLLRRTSNVCEQSEWWKVAEILSALTRDAATSIRADTLLLCWHLICYCAPATSRFFVCYF